MKFRPKKAYFFESGRGPLGLSQRSVQAKISQLLALLAELDLAGGRRFLGLGFGVLVFGKIPGKTPP